MAYVAKDILGEAMFANEPKARFTNMIENWGDFTYEDIMYEGSSLYEYDTRINLPDGTIEKIIGKKLSILDDPVELKEKWS